MEQAHRRELNMLGEFKLGILQFREYVNVVTNVLDSEPMERVYELCIKGAETFMKKSEELKQEFLSKEKYSVAIPLDIEDEGEE